ncbi:MAG TPA: VTT domain-containing protein [Syntrophomonadaceae bacterium]|nr:VTT domain-containing protein [Syntrophomonadaceae bacterium]
MIAGAAGMVFGKFWGFWLAYLGALSGAVSLFGATRALSGDRVERWLFKRYHFDLKGLNPWQVFGVLFTARLFPVVPTTIINVGSAVSGVPFRIFFLSSLLGKILWAAVYVCLGQYLIRTHNLAGTLTAVGMILLVSILGITYFRQRLPIRKISEKVDNY